MSGVFLIPYSDSPNVEKGQAVWLRERRDDRSQQFVTVDCETSQPFEPFNKAEIKGGHWTRVFALIHPVVEFRWEYTTEVGLVNTNQSIKSSNVDFSLFDIFQIKMKAKINQGLVTTTTFNKKKVTTNKVTVGPGKDFAIW